MIQWNKFGLIWSYILKDMKFLTFFRIFSEIFWIFNEFFRILMNFSEYKIDLFNLKSIL